MLYGKVQGVDKEISRIVFGCAEYEMHMGRDVSPLLDAAVAHGINAFDTARVYGESEVSLGNWLKRQKREQLVVITKGCHPTENGTKRVNRKAILEDLEISLEKLQTDYIDLYLLHRDDESVPVEELVETLDECRRQGKIRAYGGSNWTHTRLAEANLYAKKNGLAFFTCSSPYLALAEQVNDLWSDGISLTGEQNAGRTWHLESGMPVLAYSALAHGLLSGKVSSSATPEEIAKLLDPFAVKGYYSEGNMRRLARAEQLAHEKGCTVAQIALSWLFSRRMNVFAVTSASSQHRLAENAAAAELRLTQSESDWLNLERESY